MTDYIDVVVPRGGKGLVGLVQREARVPVFAHLEGIVHIYIDAAADLAKTLEVVLNSKTRRTGICGAAECLLIHQDVVDTIGFEVVQALIEAGVEVRAGAGIDGFSGTQAASAEDWGKEYLSSIIAAKSSCRYGSCDCSYSPIRLGHTDCIMTEDNTAKQRSLRRLIARF